MVVLFSDGFECPPNTAPDTFTAWSPGKTGSPTIQNTVVHSGTYAMEVTATADYYVWNWINGGANSYPELHGRFYIYIADASVDTMIMLLRPNVGDWMYIQVTGNEWNISDFSTYGDTTSGANIQNNHWYCVEAQRTVGTPGIARLYVDNIQVLSEETKNIAGNGRDFICGHYVDTANSTVYIDDAVMADDYIGPMAEGAPASGQVLTCLWKV